MSAKTTRRQGTAVSKKYQTKTPDTSSLAMPERVSVAMNEIAENMGEGRLALAVGAGLQVMAQLMEADVSAVCGPRGRHDPARAATRHGTEAGSVTLGGRHDPHNRTSIVSTSAACGLGSTAPAGAAKVARLVQKEAARSSWSGGHTGRFSAHRLTANLALARRMATVETGRLAGRRQVASQRRQRR